MTNRLQSWRV